jgi:hypothetical protein
MWCKLCVKGEKKQATIMVRSYSNLKGDPDVYCCDEHAAILAMNLIKEVDTVAIRKVVAE